MATLPRKFEVGFRFQEHWGLLSTRGIFLLIAFYLGGVGAGLYCVSSFLNFHLGLILGILIISIGKNGGHLLFVTRPERFWRAFRMPHTSWISRGVYFVVIFMVFSILDIAPTIAGYEWLPWTSGGALRVIAILAAFLVMVYTGLVMGYSRPIPFWNTALIPLAFLSYSLAAGIDIIFALLPALSGSAINVELLELIEIFLIISTLIFIGTYIVTMHNSTAAARESVRLLMRGSLVPHFIGGVLIAGAILPLGITVYTYLMAIYNPLVFATAGILVLAGCFLFRYCLFRAGIYNPVV